MKSKLSHPDFRTRWLGYDRGEVDAFLALMADEYTQPNVAYVRSLLDHQRQCEATIQKLQAQLRIQESEGDVSQHTRDHLERILTSVIGTLQEARAALHSDDLAHRVSTVPKPAAPIAQPARTPDTPDRRFVHLARLMWRRLHWGYSMATLAVLLGLGTWHLTGAVPTLGAPTAPSRPITPSSVPALADVISDPPTEAATSTLPTQLERVAESLTIVLKAHGPCWVATTLDGQHRSEYLLRAGEERMLHAQREVVLRVGNAGAVSLIVNGLVMSPLGRRGEVLTRRITPANYNKLAGSQHDSN